MTWWKYKSLFKIKWREPYGFTRVVNKLQEISTPWWVRPFWAAVTSAVLFVLWNSIKSDGINTAFVLLSSLIVGFGIIYFAALVHYLATREIGLSEKALVINAGLNTQGCSYEKMSKVEFTKLTFRKKEFDVMFVTMANSQELMLAVPDKVDRTQVIELLKSKGVETIPPAI